MKPRLKALATPTVVEARFEEDKSLTPLAFRWGGARMPVTSHGRAWATGEGENRRWHYLVMTAGQRTFELTFAPDILCWWVAPAGGRAVLV